MSDHLPPLPTSPPQEVSDANEKKMHGSVHQSSTELSSMSAIQSSHHVLSPKPNAGGNHNHTPPSHAAAVSPTQPLDSANTTYNTLYNELEKTLRTEFYDKLRTHMYDGLYTDLSERLPSEFADKPSIEVVGKPFTQVYIQLFPEVYTKLSDEVVKKLSGELLMKIANEVPDELPHDLFMKLINDLHTKLSKELSFYASGQLYNQLFSKLHADIYNQLVNPLANQMTDSTMADEDGFTPDTNGSPQPVSSFTITSTDGQLDIPQLGDGKKLRLRSYEITPFALHIIMLAVLAENPDILLPLASLKECFFDHIHRLNEESFRERNVPARCNKTVIKMMIGITCARLNYVIGRLYPPSKEEIGTDPRKRVIPELEEEGCPILQDIIRDSLLVYNPMRVLLSYLRSVTTRYNTLSNAAPETPQAKEFDTFMKRDVLSSDNWMYELRHLCSLYGLYLWDSQWMADEEWKELVHHMEIFYTKMFPDARTDFAIVEGDGEKQVGTYRFCVNRFFKSILRCIASCFAFRYRPMKDPSWLNVPYGRRPGLVDFNPVLIETGVHQQVMQIFPDVLKQCVTECMSNPTTTALMQSPHADSRLKDKYLLTASDTIADAKGHTSTHDYIMSELDDAFENVVDGWALGDLKECKSVKWTPKVVGYGRDDMTSRMVYLIDCIVKHPPTVDPVYNRIKDVFPKKVNLSNIINDGCFPLSGDPGFKCHESSSSSS